MKNTKDIIRLLAEERTKLQATTGAAPNAVIMNEALLSFLKDDSFSSAYLWTNPQSGVSFIFDKIMILTDAFIDVDSFLYIQLQKEITELVKA